MAQISYKDQIFAPDKTYITVKQAAIIHKNELIQPEGHRQGSNGKMFGDGGPSNPPKQVMDC